MDSLIPCRTIQDLPHSPPCRLKSAGFRVFEPDALQCAVSNVGRTLTVKSPYSPNHANMFSVRASLPRRRRPKIINIRSPSSFSFSLASSSLCPTPQLRKANRAAKELSKKNSLARCAIPCSPKMVLAKSS